MGQFIIHEPRFMNRTAVCLVMLLLAALPDAMFAPALNTILVDRYEVAIEHGFWFMSINLVGMLLVLPLLPRLRRAVSPAMLIAVAGLANGVLYGLMSLPIGLPATLVLRALEGAPDLVSLAVVLTLLGGSGQSDSGSGLRFGLAGTTMMLALFVGLIVGGFASGGGEDAAAPLRVFMIATVECVLLAVVAFAARHRLPGSGDVLKASERVKRDRKYPVWPAMVFMFSDRGLAGVLSVAGALYMETQLELSPRLTSSLLAMTVLLLAICNGPLGFLADNFGLLRIRAMAVAGYGLCFMGIALSTIMPMGWLVAMMGVMGLAGAGLIPTAFTLGSRHGSGATDMGLLQTAGQWGYFAAIAICGWLVSGKENVEAMEGSTWNLIFVLFGLAYLVLNAIAMLGIVWRRIARPSLSGSGST